MLCGRRLRARITLSTVPAVVLASAYISFSLPLAYSSGIISIQAVMSHPPGLSLRDLRCSLKGAFAPGDGPAALVIQQIPELGLEVLQRDFLDMVPVGMRQRHVTGIVRCRQGLALPCM